MVSCNCVLIGPYWTVNENPGLDLGGQIWVLIGPYWTVNLQHGPVSTTRPAVLIGPYWTVNLTAAIFMQKRRLVLIGPYWTVNQTPADQNLSPEAVLIGPYWTVNDALLIQPGVKDVGFNWSILDCKRVNEITVHFRAPSFNWSILDCKHQISRCCFKRCGQVLIGPYWTVNIWKQLKIECT